VLPHCLMTCANESLENFQQVQAQNRTMASPAQAHQNQTQWSKAPHGRIKLNWDAAVDQTKN